MKSTSQADLPKHEHSNVEEEADSEELKSSETGNKRMRLVSPLNELSPGQSQRRKDGLLSALKEEAMKPLSIQTWPFRIHTSQV